MLNFVFVHFLFHCQNMCFQKRRKKVFSKERKMLHDDTEKRCIILMDSFFLLTFRTNEKQTKKIAGFSKKSTPPSHSSHHSTTISPQPMLTEKSSLHEKSLEKSKYKSVTPDERPGLSLPEVKGADGRWTVVFFFFFFDTCHQVLVFIDIW